MRAPRCTTSILGILLCCASPAVVHAQVLYDRMITFSGYDWLVKSSADPVGPGPNYFSSDPRDVRVDGRGRLHLHLVRRHGRWLCSEVVSSLSLGHGTYRFYLERPVDALDPNVVLGLFTWNNDDPSYFNREIDIEFSRWGNPADPTNAQYVVQPYDVPGNLTRFTEPRRFTKSTHAFLWLPGSISFQSLRGHYVAPPDPSYLIQEWTTIQSVPPAGGENARLNLWLFDGQPPSNHRPVNIIVRRFEFTPAP